MSENDLTSAFGRSARDLSTRLSPNPRRRRSSGDQDGTEDTTADSLSGGTADSPDPTESEAGPNRHDDVPRERHLSAAPVNPETTSSAGPEPPAQSSTSPPTASAAATRERPAAARSRRGSGSTRSRGSGRTSESSDLDPSVSYQVPVYVHPAVRAAATTRRKTEKLTNAEIAFDAIDEVQHRLPALIRDRRLQARPDSSLFPGRVRRGRLPGGGAATTVGDARRVLWGFRATGAELEIIDRLSADTGAESRSELIAVALEETLLR